MCSLPLNVTAVCCLFVSTTATRLSWQELIEIKYWDGFDQQSIVNSIAYHSNAQCDAFANLLLKKRLYVQAARRDHPKNEDFIPVVMGEWHSSVGGPPVPVTWKHLIECMRAAGLDGEMIEIIENNIPHQV